MINKVIQFGLTSLTILFLSNVIIGQTHFTQYDNCPKIINSYKPAFENSYPEWAKMLYQETINFHEIVNFYKLDLNKKDVLLKPISRYFKLWKRAIEPWVLDDGTIKLPSYEAYYKALKDSQVNANQVN